MQVVEHDDDGDRRRKASQETRNGIEQSKSSLNWIGYGQRCTRVRDELGQERLEIEDAPSGFLFDCRSATHRDNRSKNLNPRPVRGRATGLPAAPPRNGRLGSERRSRELVREPRLADTGFSRDEGHPASPLRCALESPCKIGKLASAAEESRFSQSPLSYLRNRGAASLTLDPFSWQRGGAASPNPPAPAPEKPLPLSLPARSAIKAAVLKAAHQS
jgi:hypothetical protein